MKSIRFYLIATILAAMTLLIFLSALHGYNKSTKEAKFLLDKQLIYMANVLSELPFETGGSRAHEKSIVIDTLTVGRAFQIWQDEKLVSRSGNAPDTPIARLTAGFQDSNFNQYRWRNYIHHNQDTNHWVIAAERTDIRNRLIDNLIIESALPVIIILPIASIIIWFLVGSGLKPIRQLTQQLQLKQANDLSPVFLNEPLKELQPLINSTNSLLARLKNSFEREKHFSADAAHELRTPISILKIHLYNLQADSPDNEKLQPLISAVERMGHLIEQILSLYRTTPDQYMANFKSIDLYHVLQDSIAQQYSMFEAKNQQIELFGETAVLQSDKFILETLLMNLLSNASKYTPENGNIEISIRTCNDDKSGNDYLELKIEDSGPGIPADKYHRIFDRFYRLHGDQHNSKIEGCGLGLSIVQHIVQLHNGTIKLSPSKFDSGLAVTIQLPLTNTERTVITNQ